MERSVPLHKTIEIVSPMPQSPRLHGSASPTGDLRARSLASGVALVALAIAGCDPALPGPSGTTAASGAASGPGGGGQGGSGESPSATSSGSGGAAPTGGDQASATASTGSGAGLGAGGGCVVPDLPDPTECLHYAPVPCGTDLGVAIGDALAFAQCELYCLENVALYGCTARELGGHTVVACDTCELPPGGTQ